MKKILAENIRVCIFTWNDYNTFDEATGDDKAAMDAVRAAVQELQKRHGQVPIEYGFCPLTIADNQLLISQEGIDPSNLPAVQMYATYSDGTGGYYWLKKSLLTAWTKDVVTGPLTALLYRSKPSEQSLLCKVFPIVCQIPSWLWLVAAGFATFEAVTSQKGVRQIGYAAGAGLAWQEFFSRGGFSALKK